MDLDFIIPVSLFIVIAYIIKVISDNRVKQRLIERGEIDEKIKLLYSDRLQSHNLSSLKWGLVLTGLGLALFIGQLFPRTITEEMTVGGMFIFAGVAFLIYYGIAKSQHHEEQGDLVEGTK
jgi:hypothetical protein